MNRISAPRFSYLSDLFTEQKLRNLGSKFDGTKKPIETLEITRWSVFIYWPLFKPYSLWPFEKNVFPKHPKIFGSHLMVHKITPPKNMEKSLKINGWNLFWNGPFFAGTSEFSGVYLHFVSCSFCVCFFIQPFDPDANPRHVPWTMEHPKNVPFPVRSFEPKINLKKQSSKFASSTHSSLLQWRRDNSSCHLEGSPFFFDLLLNRGIRWPQSAPDLHGFENRQEITVSSCFVCERSNQLVWCLSRTKSGDLIDPDRYSWYVYIYIKFIIQVATLEN